MYYYTSAGFYEFTFGKFVIEFGSTIWEFSRLRIYHNNKIIALMDLI